MTQKPLRKSSHTLHFALDVKSEYKSLKTCLISMLLSSAIWAELKIFLTWNINVIINCLFFSFSFKANLKMDRNTTQEALYEHMNCIVNTLGMNKFLDTRISFLSGGERKKVALAVQLLNDPPILFCDEITTGLDSYSAAHIVNTLKVIAQTGKIVICTIHQPASGVFGKLDEVILMSNGRLAYQGPIAMVNQMFQKYAIYIELLLYYTRISSQWRIVWWLKTVISQSQPSRSFKVKCLLEGEFCKIYWNIIFFKKKK